MLPATATLEELALAIVSSIEGRSVASLSRSHVIVVQFVRFDSGYDAVMPYTDTVGKWRDLCNRGLAKVVIDDGSGGSKRPPVPVTDPTGGHLVDA